jgi:hypothetical protein
MAEPACKDCKWFDDETILGSRIMTCQDPTKRIYPRRASACGYSEPPLIPNEEYTCGNWTSRGCQPNTLDELARQEG